MGEVIQDLPVINVVLYMLGIWGGTQDSVVVAYMDKYLYDRYYTVAVIARHALGSVSFRMPMIASTGASSIFSARALKMQISSIIPLGVGWGRGSYSVVCYA